LLNQYVDNYKIKLYIFYILAEGLSRTLSDAGKEGPLGKVLPPNLRGKRSPATAKYAKPYFKNFGKRLVKTPKLYFIDSAIVCTLTRQPSGEASLGGPLGGPLLEGFIISETLKVFAAKGERAECFFWRSHDGLEVDLVLQIQGKLDPVEIKLTATPTLKHHEPLNRFKSLAGADGGPQGVLICRIEKPIPLPQNNFALPWQKFPEWLQERLS